MIFQDIKERIDYKTALIALALVTIGIISVYSATYDARAAEIFHKQVLWVGVGVLALAIMAAVPFRLLQLVSYPAYFLSILMLVIVLILGRTVSGSMSWFNLGPLRLQPSEFTKITTVLALATYLSRSDVSLRKIRDLAIAAGIVLLPVTLIMMQPDTGTALIFFGMFFPVLFWGGASRFTLVAIVAPVATAVAALFGTTPFLTAVLVFAPLGFLWTAGVTAGTRSEFLRDLSQRRPRRWICLGGGHQERFKSIRTCVGGEVAQVGGEDVHDKKREENSE